MKASKKHTNESQEVEKIDRVPSELRKIEEEVIDRHYKSNLLVGLPFATAAWSLLAFAEEMMLEAEKVHGGTQHYTTVIDNFVNALKEPMYWLYREHKQGSQIPSAYDINVYQASGDLFKLGLEYGSFVAAYTYATRGKIGLKTQGSTIQPTPELFADREYEAYNRFMKQKQVQETSFSVDFYTLQLLLEDAIKRSLKIDGDRFCYELDIKMVSDTIKAMEPKFDNMFSLPGEWCFGRYTLADFRRVFEAISAIAYIHSVARIIAGGQGCDKWGYLDSIYLTSCDNLLTDVVEYSGVSEAKIENIFDDLTYGNRGIKHPDPVLQPLIKLNSEVYAIMPQLWLSISPERNLTVLLNKLQCEKKIYLDLVAEKECLMRKSITTDLDVEGFRFFSGGVPDSPDVNLGDIDLAIISDSEKMCLLLELKWFIYPAEISEIIDRSENIENGVCQSLKLKRAFVDNHKLLLEKLDIDSSYRLEAVVVSHGWIGHAKVQSPEIPVIQVDDLIAKLKETESLQSTTEWLKTRKYLPKEGKDFRVCKTTSTIGNWSVEWDKIELLAG